jgi:hypothetical protein
VSKQDKPRQGEQSDGQNVTPPAFGAGSFGAGVGASAGTGPAAAPPGVSPLLPPPESLPNWVPPASTGPNQFGPGTQPANTQPSIGWQAAQQPGGYFPAAGPLASSAGKGDDDLAWGNTGRKTLINVLLFGVAPLVLAGVVAIAYVFSSSGKGHPAASVGFHPATASAGIPQVQDASTPTAGAISVSPSPKASRKASPSPSLSFPAMPAQSGAPAPGVTATRQAAPKKKPGPRRSHSASPKPSAKPSAVAVPADLGAPNFAGYCTSINQGFAVNLGGTAYSWHCTSAESTALSSQAVCAFTYHQNTADMIDVTVNYNTSFTDGVACWSTHGELDPLDLGAYCAAEGWGKAVFGSNATAVSCSGNPDIDETTACQVTFNDSSAFARYSAYSVADSWQCWG